ncbi:MAG: DUF2808 domain-containing protein [Pegethrix bostrychoides GSE-TBD4-15B]|jgi:hypothetical protein|uniref:DUF2808 domain-containing protein n=1 Tax=Pegethrix bostrychoides GSE-TBD4-15B TaxID=2839662 RepID=A0A951U592_9CYAN|nr:DUF2808 domain-containing protein [Pegethrix bostrychoides GSE-TBD4-15B]
MSRFQFDSYLNSATPKFLRGLSCIGAALLISAQTPPLNAQLNAQSNESPHSSAPFNHLPILVEPATARQLTSARQTYAIRIKLPADAGAALAAVQIRQPNPEQALSFDLSQTAAFQTTFQAAFQGTTKLGDAVTIQAAEQLEPSQIQISFAQPLQPGTTLTLLLKPRHLPTGRNQYPLIISAVPVGAELGSELGQQQIETCRSRYDPASDGRVLFWDLPPEFNPYIRNRPCQR